MQRSGSSPSLRCPLTRASPAPGPCPALGGHFLTDHRGFRLRSLHSVCTCTYFYTALPGTPCACMLQRAAFAGEVKREGPCLWPEPLPQPVQLTVSRQQSGTHRAARAPCSWEQRAHLRCKQGPGDSPSPVHNYSFHWRRTETRCTMAFSSGWQLNTQ